MQIKNFDEKKGGNDFEMKFNSKETECRILLKEIDQNWES
jgi:hypothetical protein